MTPRFRIDSPSINTLSYRNKNRANNRHSIMRECKACTLFRFLLGIALSDFHILNPRGDPEFPFLRSTPLYPEWPFSKVKHASNHLAQRVAIALLQMPEDHLAARAGQYAGWTIPLD